LKKLFILLCGVLFASPAFPAGNSEIAAIINLTRRETITVQQVRAEVERLEIGFGRTLTQTERTEALDVMINEILALQAAERDRITTSDTEIDQYIQQLRDQLTQIIGRVPTEQELSRAIQDQTGYDYSLFIDRVRKQMIIHNYILSRTARLISSIRIPTEDEIRERYNQTRSQLVRDGSQLSLDDIIQPGYDITVRDYIREFIFQERQQEIYNQASIDLVAELRAASTIEIFEQNLNW